MFKRKQTHHGKQNCHELDITLYEYGPSRSKQVRWALLELELEFNSIEGLEILHSDELKKVNPMGKVPAVLINGEPLFEAAAICTYLADLVPEKEAHCAFRHTRPGPAPAMGEFRLD